MRKKVVTMGEILLRLSSPGYERFSQAEALEVIYGGAEANIAVSLANFGVDAYFVSQLPDNDIGQCAVNHLRKYGVNTEHIVRAGERIGIYFFEKGTSVRPSKVIYDRKYSSITEAQVENFDFDEIFKDADWFHFSGITPALGENCIKLAQKAREAAIRNKVPFSVDLNYRKKLWSYEEFEQVMPELIQDAEVCFGWLSSIEKNSQGYKLFDLEKHGLDKEKFNTIFKDMSEKYNIKCMISTLRENYSASNNGLSAIMYADKELYQSKKYNFTIEDRVGTGDAFAAGLIYKLVQGENYKDAIEFGVAAAVIKHSIPGDCNLVSEAEIMDIVNGNTSGSVKR